MLSVCWSQYGEDTAASRDTSDEHEHDETGENIIVSSMNNPENKRTNLRSQEDPKISKADNTALHLKAGKYISGALRQSKQLRRYRRPAQRYQGPLQERYRHVQENKVPFQRYQGHIKEYYGPVQKYHGPVQRYQGRLPFVNRMITGKGRYRKGVVRKGGRGMKRNNMVTHRGLNHHNTRSERRQYMNHYTGLDRTIMENSQGHSSPTQGTFLQAYERNNPNIKQQEAFKRKLLQLKKKTFTHTSPWTNIYPTITQNTVQNLHKNTTWGPSKTNIIGPKKQKHFDTNSFLKGKLSRLMSSTLKPTIIPKQNKKLILKPSNTNQKSPLFINHYEYRQKNRKRPTRKPPSSFDELYPTSRPHKDHNRATVIKHLSNFQTSKESKPRQLSVRTPNTTEPLIEREEPTTLSTIFYPTPNTSNNTNTSLNTTTMIPYNSHTRLHTKIKEYEEYDELVEGEQEQEQSETAEEAMEDTAMLTLHSLTHSALNHLNDKSPHLIFHVNLYHKRPRSIGATQH